jgi:transposase
MSQKSKQSRQKYSKEFKLEAVKLALEGEKSQAEIARDLGIHPHMMCRWIKEYKAVQADAEAAFPGKGKLSPQDQRVKDLEEKLRQVTMERDILKKATAYFAKLQP